ncbi:MAG: beta-hydroxyacyl-ACP dehydratase [Spirochaetes bacterium GWD1_61_31]|nr:MAG: beta-hydroxyacyl-ACP dehydratase [Spirochaetes bacterium GWB1_60_80]OHD33495.1 MAG: beta-hydroxyacyl-ACP dehydratase [Spirochaetes bacterium GWC1_61_12]OHD36904.1 MAG: beta-hydroxyacyl-ACP dehydratase [Spirochaetes bacterium GWD1_61_31]OHD42630.1 MAG: beta-hydroxyacyl-ACP dehydratase [Spirochaetes bacterium GWE1_60_18]OHD58012.1 MAG: beta-hydroxyacyl-ACP dehydratase [Spirochaetes bacterium GWF1_60_12]HAP42615.1 beta-hydroxyacyl-ACP dehydratase [Spirochaetaceae bacterium]
MKAVGEEIKKILPHRDPFLFVDECEDLEDGTIVAKRVFKDSEPFFKGHFPDYPVVPGVILVETMAQAGGVGVKLSGACSDGLFFLAAVNNVKFRKQVRPNDTFDIKVTNLRVSSRIIKQQGVGTVNGEVAIEADWTCIVGAPQA